MDTTFVKIFNPHIVSNHGIPAKLLCVSLPKHIFVHLLRHLHRCAFQLIIGSPIIDIWGITQQMLIYMNNNHLLTITIRNIHILYSQIHEWFNFSYFPGYFLPSIV